MHADALDQVERLVAREEWHRIGQTDAVAWLRTDLPVLPSGDQAAARTALAELESRRQELVATLEATMDGVRGELADLAARRRAGRSYTSTDHRPGSSA